MIKNHQLGFFLILKQCFFLMFILTPWAKLSAGLIIDIDKNIDVSWVKKISSNRDQLIIDYKGGQRILKLPRNSLDPIIIWASQKCSGPFVFSVDGALVPGNSRYIPPCIPSNLGRAMIDYDIYAHELAQGSLPSDKLPHPLIRKNKNDLLMPHQQYGKLMNLKNNSQEAVWFRHLTSRYTNYTGCVGELTMKATSKRKGFPVEIGVSSYRWIRPQLWYRAQYVSVPNEQDHLTLSLPYNELDKDIESNFIEYRKAFKPLDELASIVEAYAILDKIAQTNVQLWNRFISQKYRQLESYQATSLIPTSSSPRLISQNLSSTPSWNSLSIQSIGSTVETSAEADLALSFLWSDPSLIKKFPQWLIGIKELAIQDIDIHCKFILYETKNNKSLLKNNIHTFIDKVGNGMKHFRLRVMGYHFFQGFYLGEASIFRRDTSQARTRLLNEIRDLLSHEKQKIISDFIQKVDSLKINKDTDNNFLIWEDLSQSIYSVNTLNLIYDAPNQFDVEFAKRLAYVHYRRGIAEQKGLCLAYRHAHFRFLKYLNEKIGIKNKELANDIFVYRSELADKMGLEKWDEKQPGFGLTTLTSDIGKKSKELSSDTPFPMVAGKIISTTFLFENQPIAPSEIAAPLCLQTPEGKNILLLMDSRIINNAFGKTASKWPKNFKVYGIFQNNKNAITPQRIEYYLDNKWQVLNLPHSGISESGVLSGN